MPQLPTSYWPDPKIFQPLARMSMTRDQAEFYQRIWFAEVDVSEAPGGRKAVFKSARGTYFALITTDTPANTPWEAKLTLLVGGDPSREALEEYVASFQHGKWAINEHNFPELYF